MGLLDVCFPVVVCWLIYLHIGDLPRPRRRTNVPAGGGWILILYIEKVGC